MSDSSFDVVVVGEILVEVITDAPFVSGGHARLGVSGDALNVAAAAAAAGARAAIVAVLTDDELGRAIAEEVEHLGVSTELLRYRTGQQGMYLVHCDPDGERDFSYARRGSAGSFLRADDLDESVIRSAGSVVASGIACAVSESAQATVLRASELTERFVFDPNFRRRLTDEATATSLLAKIAPRAFVITPSFPGETSALLGGGSARDAAQKLIGWGARAVAVTCGATGVQLMDSDGTEAWIDAIPAPVVVDQTGAGDAYVGTLTARLVLGDSFVTAATLAAAASSLVVGGRGGTGFVPTLDQTRAHAGISIGGGS
ncbi:PfkB family carbohydrate kinase [Luethyella okanaganae]|uniref:PfkB family carbohydrate kinase n=1 Tax=Luethyella okanaganae TaxID=69372 RepID=A0ABW1VD70_9MICO